MPVTAKQAFYFALPVVHAIGALLAVGLSFGCDTGKGQQTARVPRVVPGQGNAFFVQAYPWDEDNEFVTHTWNPFALIFLFEWLTAGFALRTLAYYVDAGIILRVWLGWLGAGLVVFIAWTATNSGGPCVAMLILGVFSFLASALLALALFVWPESFGNGLLLNQAGRAKGGGAFSLIEDQYQDRDGRVWRVPKATTLLRKRRADRLQTGGPAELASPVDNEVEIELGVVLRFAEYCITAPLLFLAVVCLLTVDGPAWLYLCGYWLLLVCNAFGVVLHLNFSADPPPTKGLHLLGLWGSTRSNQISLLQAAWVSLLLPTIGLIFVIRGYLLSGQLPALAQFIIWNLLLTYTMFGIIPTFVYITDIGRARLPWLLDILNIAAKFPLPLVILSGFVMRPATTKFCYN